MNCKISSNLEELNELHSLYNWIPNSSSIRPNSKITENKKRLFNKIEAFYKTYRDYILIDLFNTKSRYDIEGKLESIENPDLPYKFLPNRFPYNLIENSNHYVMWYISDNVNKEQINTDISKELYKLLGHNRYKFVWYENPKMNIPDVYHVQVFWIKTS